MGLDTYELLKALVEKNGVSGAENSTAQYVKEILSSYGETSIDVLGNVICKVGRFDDSKPTLLLDAHIDEIGMIVTYITNDGFLKVSNVGGIDNRVLTGQTVKIYGKRAVDGVIASTPPHLKKDNSAAADISDIYIDTGMTGSEAEEIISLGDRVCIYNSLEKLEGSFVTSHALDNRAGCVSVILAADMLENVDTEYNVCVLLSVQEEVGERGAKTGAFSFDCDKAIIVDVSFGLTHGEDAADCGVCGNGGMIGIAPSLSREMSEELINIAKDKDIPYQIEVMNGRTGTNADAIGISKGGAKTVTLSVPLKHMHTPVEVVDMRDIENTARLICEYIK